MGWWKLWIDIQKFRQDIQTYRTRPTKTDLKACEVGVLVVHSKLVVPSVYGHLSVQRDPDHGVDEDDEKPQGGDVGDGGKRVDQSLNQEDDLFSPAQDSQDSHEFHQSHNANQVWVEGKFKVVAEGILKHQHHVC